jgi:hypothetical protein
MTFLKLTKHQVSHVFCFQEKKHMFAGYANGLNMSNSKSFNPSCMGTQLHGFSILEIHSIPQGIRRFRVAFGAACAGFSST